MSTTKAVFLDTAEKRFTQIVASGKTIRWNEMRRILERRLSSRKTARPKPRRRAR